MDTPHSLVFTGLGRMFAKPLGQLLYAKWDALGPFSVCVMGPGWPLPHSHCLVFGDL